jgi:hypothetical protein
MFLTFYKETETAEVCHPFEAAEWIALGRVPEFFFDGRDGEARTDLRAEANGFVIDPHVTPTPTELAAWGVEVDYQDYLDAKFSSPGFDSIAEAEAAIVENKARLEGLEIEPLSSAAYYRTSLDEDDRRLIELVESSEAQIRYQIELARVSVIKEMMSGNLVTSGFRFKIREGEFDLDDDAEIEVIEPQRIRLSSMDWDENTLRTSSAHFSLVHFDTSDVFRIFPRPEIAQKRISGEVAGSTLILAKEGQRAPTARQRVQTRQNRRDIAGIVSKEFERRGRKGLLPDKREAIYAEAIEWTNDVLGQKSSRSSMQRYLTEVIEKYGK